MPQILASVVENAWREICVLSPDTYVLLLLPGLGVHTHHKFLTAKGTMYRQIDLVERVRLIGSHKCQGLVGLHHFFAAYWGEEFVGITNKRWVRVYMKNNEYDPEITALGSWVKALFR